MRNSSNKTIYQQHLDRHTATSAASNFEAGAALITQAQTKSRSYRKRRISILEVRSFLVFGVESNTNKNSFSVPVSPSHVSSSRTQIAVVLPITSRRARKETCHRSKADTISEVSILTHNVPLPYKQRNTVRGISSSIPTPFVRIIFGRTPA